MILLIKILKVYLVNNMKKLLLITILVFSLNCFSQTIIPIYNTDIDQSGVYYKDTFNDYDKFVGTWKYTNGTTSLTITLQKKLHQSVTENNGTTYYMDFIVGGYKYIENGIEKINTLSQLSQSLNVIEYNLDGCSIFGPNSVFCLNCGPNDRVLFLSFTDPNRYIEGFEPQMLFKRVDSGGVQKLELNFRTISGGWEEEGVTPQYTSYTVPFGTYILTKQP